MRLDLVKHDMGGADIQNKRGVSKGSYENLQKYLYWSWDLSSSGGQRALTLMRSHGLLPQSKKLCIYTNCTVSNLFFIPAVDQVSKEEQGSALRN